ncbi:MAG: M56 family metallopeptidase, partial [Planctomycetales bacterium]
MDTLAWTFDRLFEWAVVSSILLVLGSLAALCCRQPIRRMRVIEFTLASCLVAPLVSLAPGLPRWTLPWMSAVETAPAHARLKTASVGGAASPRNANGPQTEPVLSSRHSGDADLDPQTSVADLASDLAIGPLDLSATDMPPIELAETEDVQLTSDASADVRSDAPSATFSDTLPKAPPDAPTANPAIGARSDDQPATAVESPPIAPLSIDDEPDPPRVSAQSMTTVGWTAMNLPVWVVSGYAVGLILLTSWLLIGLAGLRRVLRTCRAAPEWCRRLLEEIAGPAGARVRLLVSPRAPQPFTFAWRPATIVLPEALLNSRTAVREEDSGSMARASPSALRLALAHEWSHVTRGDVWSWSLAGLVRLLFFYQPLCWWLRGQLRLCQDFLADSDAAREATPATYAEFLASRAAGRPLAIGLGIAGGKSDLYRRITMLLQIQKPLETRCSKSWTIAVATVVVGAILLTGTFGERPAALGEMDAVGDSEPTIVKKPADQEKPTKRSPTEAESRPTTQEASERQVIVDRMLSRQYKADSARIEYRRTVERGGDIIQQGDSILTVAPNGWLLQQPIGNGSQQVTLVQEGRCFQFQSWEESAAAAGGGGGAAAAMMSQMTGRMAGMRGGVSVGGVGVPAGGAPGGMAGDAPRGPRGRARNPNAMAGGAPTGIPGGMPGGMPGGPGGMPRGMPGAAFSGWGSGSVPLEVTYPEAVPAYADAWIPFGFGTLYYKSGCEFVRRHAAAMRLGELQEVNGIQARLLEWDVPPAEAAQAFPIVNQFLSLGAVLRLFIDEKREGAVIRIEGIDPFDTLQFQVDFSDFAFIDKKLSPLPQKARIVSGDTVETIELLRAEGINKTIKPETFTLHIAAGTVVSDARLKRTDKIDPEQKTLNRDGQTYPLRSFTTTVPYPNGFPVKLLKELDRETLPWEEARKAMHWG